MSFKAYLQAKLVAVTRKRKNEVTTIMEVMSNVPLIQQRQRRMTKKAVVHRYVDEVDFLFCVVDVFIVLFGGVTTDTPSTIRV